MSDCCLLFVTLVAIGQAPASDAVDEALRSGKEASRLGHLEDAIRSFTRAIDGDRTNAEAFFLRGKSFYIIGKDQEALADYSEAIKLKPNHADALSSRGHYYVMHNENEKAIRDLSEAIRIAPDGARAYIDRGCAYYDDGKYSEALVNLKEGVRRDAKHLGGHSQLSEVLSACPDRKYRDGKKALEHAEVGYKLATASKDQWLIKFTLPVLAMANAECGQYEAAIQYQKRVVDMEDDKSPVKPREVARLKLFQEHKPLRIVNLVKGE
jgi:tetratricopeptide (TPR) repeat protein